MSSSKKKLQKAFVTGGTGFVGSHVAKELLDNGWEVTCLVRKTSDLSRLEGLDIELTYGDITDYDSIRTAMEGHDSVFHIAAYYSMREINRELMYQVNVEGTRNVLTAMQQLEIPKGVYCSTVAVLGDTNGQVADENHENDEDFRSEYERTKYFAHQEAEKFIEEGLPLTIVMPGGIYGPGDTSMVGQTIRDFLHRKMPAMLKTKTTFSFVHVEDVANGVYLAATEGQDGESYILGGENYTIPGFLNYLSELSGVQPPKLSIGMGTAKVLAKIGQVLPYSIRQHLLYPEEVTMINGPTWSVTSEKAKKELGWEPRSLKEGLEETIEWYQKN